MALDYKNVVAAKKKRDKKPNDNNHAVTYKRVSVKIRKTGDIGTISMMSGLTVIPPTSTYEVRLSNNIVKRYKGAALEVLHENS